MKQTTSYAGLSLSLLRDIDIANARFADALKRYETIYPEIVSADTPGIHRANYYAAVDIAYLYLRSGKEKQGRQLLQAAIPVIDTVPILGIWGSALGNARTYALLGRKDAALAEVQRGVDAGWRIGWRYTFDHDPIFDSLRAKIATDMAAQLRRVRELEASGEILTPEMQEGQ